MQRQSLGSPGSKAAGGAAKEEKRKSIAMGGVAGSPAPASPTREREEAAFEAEKLIRASSKADRSIHLIPIFTVLCLLVLYLLSHEPSLTDMQTFSGSALRSDSQGTASGVEKGGVASATRQLRRGLKSTAAVAAAARRPPHRKLMRA